MEYWIVVAQLPFDLIKGIFLTEKEAKKLFNKISSKRCPLIYPCCDKMIRRQFGWRNYMEKQINQLTQTKGE